MKLIKSVDQLEQHLNHFEVVNTNVSSRGVDWHIDHTLKVIISIIVSLKESNPTEYQWKFNFLRTYILFSGIIPRGKGRSPKTVNNLNKIDMNEVQAQLKEARKLISEINTLPKNSNFKHPYFGLLNLRPTKLFLLIHTKHHLKIINDIVEK